MIVERIGEGTFGEVSKARRMETGGTVALKRVRIRSLDAGARPAVGRARLHCSPPTPGIPPNVFREMQALKLLSHPNVVHLHECFPHGASVVLVMEYMTTDLYEVRVEGRAPTFCAWEAASRCRGLIAPPMQLLRARDSALPEEHVKGLALMMFRGLAHCHGLGVMHRVRPPPSTSRRPLPHVAAIPIFPRSFPCAPPLPSTPPGRQAQQPPPQLGRDAQAG